MYPPEFEEFWLAYPRKVEKKNCYITWRRLTKKQQKEVIIAAKNYGKAMQAEGREDEYIKHAKVFINPAKEIWKDFLVSPQSASDAWLEKKLKEGNV